jgi:triosephosphate isomerase (TIM)
MARRKLVAGNWKMNGLGFALADMKAIDDVADTAAVDVALCVPATMMNDCATAMPHVSIGGQDCHGEASGAYTGWLSVDMLRAAGASLVIVGHSERRHYAHETDADVRGKAAAAVAAGMLPIICVGENEAERAAGQHIIRVMAQIDGSVPPDSNHNVIIAYEPVWAIGTGKVATAGDVAEMHAAIRIRLVANHGDGVHAGNGMRILYGGSVNGDNAAKLFAIADVDGALVGGASLSAAKFLPIVEAAIAAAG